MKKGLYFMMFIAGAAVSSAVTWYCVKKKYEKIAQEEIDSVKVVFAQKEGVSQVEESKAEEKMAAGVRQTAKQAKEKPDIIKYASFIQKYSGNINKEKVMNDDISNQEGEEEDIMKDKEPYVIAPEEFGEFEDYEKISLTYYADGVLADDGDEIVDDVEETVGDALWHFGEYEDDSVFVRCDEQKCDYEILLDQRNFSDVISSNPRRVEV